MKIYLVEAGEYSSPMIVAAFSNKEDADNVANAIRAHVLDPLELDSCTLAEPKGSECWRIEMTRDGDVTIDDEMPLLSDGCWLGEAGQCFEETTELRTARDFSYATPPYWRLTILRYGKSKEHVIRIANEIRSQILAGQRPLYVDFGKN